MDLVVCYDVVGDRRRTRLMRKLRAHLKRVQKSVFEGEIADDRLAGLRQVILKEIDPSEDTVRIYHLCGRCVAAVELLGASVFVDRDDADEVL